MLFYGNPFKGKSLNYQVGNNDRPKRAVNVKVLESILREQKPLVQWKKGTSGEMKIHKKLNEMKQSIFRFSIYKNHYRAQYNLQSMIKSSLAKCASIAGSNLLCQSIRIIRPLTRPRGVPVGKETLIGKDTH